MLSNMCPFQGINNKQHNEQAILDTLRENYDFDRLYETITISD